MLFSYTMEFYAADRKKELIPFAMAWMELESIMLSEISQGKIPYDLTFNWNLINKRNLFLTCSFKTGFPDNDSPGLDLGSRILHM